MNQVSWLLYLSSVLPNLKIFLVIIGIIIAITASVYLIISIVNSDGITSSYITDNKKVELLKDAKLLRRRFPSLLCVSFVLWFLAALCPSQETVLAIAASQVGEQVLKSPTANLAEQALNSWLRKQITPQPTPAAPAASN